MAFLTFTKKSRVSYFAGPPGPNFGSSVRCPNSPACLVTSMSPNTVTWHARRSPDARLCGGRLESP